MQTTLLLTACLLTASSAAAQTQPLQQAQPLKETPDPTPGKLGLARQVEPPALTPPLYYALLPGAAMLITGGIMWSQYGDDVGDPTRRASAYLMGIGTIMVAGSAFYLGARIAKRRRWTLQRRWETCRNACIFPEPRRYYGAFMLVPGVVVTLATAVTLTHDYLQWSRSEGDSDDPDDPEPRSYTAAQANAMRVLLIMGPTLIIAGTLHLMALNRQRADWRRRAHALSRMRVAPTMRPGPAASRSFGLVVSAQF